MRVLRCKINFFRMQLLHSLFGNSFFPFFFSDLTIVEAKLNAKAYTKLNDFMKDMTKIFDNCRLYNPVDTPYFQCEEVVETYFAQRVKSLRSSNKL